MLPTNLWKRPATGRAFVDELTPSSSLICVAPDARCLPPVSFPPILFSGLRNRYYIVGSLVHLAEGEGTVTVRRDVLKLRSNQSAR
ncbi:unnamed protein product [Angiostrongylus costaricensis]|uniref:Uncharacterized protein n=1 Tax=Angiostrongylus costaricensis TaxID=334426 RepID=A0A0R3Q0R8_ANGCS|nr:unnamed protein product [Angiostrongylus costaricensis]